MFVTLLVLKLLKFKFVSAEQLSNILSIFVTLLVTKPLKSKLVSFEQLPNMLVIFVTMLVLKLLNVMLVTTVGAFDDEVPPNKLLLSAGA